MDRQPHPACITIGEGWAAHTPARSPSPADPDRAVVAEAVAEAADWRRLVIRHREYAVRAAHRTYRRSVWP
jgi:hypothetical protein